MLNALGIKRFTTRISTSLADDLGEILFNDGLEEFLSLNTQRLAERPVGVEFVNLQELFPPIEWGSRLPFDDAYGEYYRELFFHVPFLIANHLNANQQFEQAKWWYERIFDPTTNEPANPERPTDRNWRYAEFRGVTLEKIEELLTDRAALAQYKADPFNPYAIARLRATAFQKAIVMKYIDNLIDWGDSLFAQDTMESINEATMLYVLASDILGRRPAKLGKCDTVKSDGRLTYDQIGPAIGQGSEFLITLENWSSSTTVEAIVDKYRTAWELNGSRGRYGSSGEESGIEAGNSSHGDAVATLAYRSSVKTYSAAQEDKVREQGILADWETKEQPGRVPPISDLQQTALVFCIPPNTDLLKYWDRVEDRLFKIRHCMNISGIRRQLALFQPPIEPMLLVRARAAGLSLEDILRMQAKGVPPYRFTHCMEKAKQFTQTVQNFGSALLSALEKKDVEELTLLRSVHKRSILRLTKDIKADNIREAQHQSRALVASSVNVQNRIDYYQGLIDAGLTAAEVTQQMSRHTSTLFRTEESLYSFAANIAYLLPQAGSPFALTYGGKQSGDSLMAISRLYGSLGAIADAVSASAGLEAGFERRRQEWEYQVKIATQELEQIKTQVLAAEVRESIAAKDLEIHEASMANAEEVYEHYKNKFTGLGLYNYLAISLTRLYREAYNLAYGMAQMAESAYQFERDDETTFITGDNWQYDRAGLLAGERLLLQLQQMDKAYLTEHTRGFEVTQSFSLALLRPDELISLKETGSCEFRIPEVLFDLYYPGQYRRLIKSVRITIPCVAGPYTNVSAVLSLTNSSWRKDTTPQSELDPLTRDGIAKSIATSNAQNDAGQFELNFRDERYLPFEGFGAVSTWSLDLPSQMRAFDYDTISDVLIHMSYKAKYDAAYKETVEGALLDNLNNLAQWPGLVRFISLRHELSNAFHQLLSPGDGQTTEFELTKRHFPYFLNDKALSISSSAGVKIYLKPTSKDPIDTSGLVFSVNSKPSSNFSLWPADVLNASLKEGTVELSGSPVTKWKITVTGTTFNKEQLEDIYILIPYTAR